MEAILLAMVTHLNAEIELINVYIPKQSNLIYPRLIMGLLFLAVFKSPQFSEYSIE